MTHYLTISYLAQLVIFNRPVGFIMGYFTIFYKHSYPAGLLYSRNHNQVNTRKAYPFSPTQVREDQSSSVGVEERNPTDGDLYVELSTHVIII